MHPRSGDDVGTVALDGGRRELPERATLVSDAVGLGNAAVDGGAGACAGEGWDIGAGRR